MSESNSIRFVGDVAIQDVSIVTSAGLTQNITNQVMAIELYEDLYSPFTTGIINVNDSFDFILSSVLISEDNSNFLSFPPTVLIVGLSDWPFIRRGVLPIKPGAVFSNLDLTEAIS